MKYLFHEIDYKAGTDVDGLPLLSVSIHRGVIPRADMTDRESRADTFGRYKRVRRGDIVINRMRAFEGGAGMSRHDGMVSTDYAVLRTNAQLHPVFLHHLIRSRWFVGEMTARLRGIGSTDMGNVRTPRINVEDLGDITVALPSPREQLLIADYLDTETSRIDAVIERRRTQVALFRERTDAVREAWFQDLVEKNGLVKIRRLARKIEQGWSPDAENEGAGPGEWGVLKTSAVSSGAFVASQNKRIPPSAVVDPRWLVADGDLLVVRGSGSPEAVGQAAVAEVGTHRLLLADLIYRVRLVSGDPHFVSEALKSPYCRAEVESSIRTDIGMTRKIRTEDLANLAIPAVPAARQSGHVVALREILHDIDQARDGVARQVELLLERRQALISAVVTGELGIPGIAP